MKKIVISEVISQAWELTKKHWLVILAYMGIISVAQYLINAIMSIGSSQTLLLAQLQSMQASGQADPFEQLQILAQIMPAYIGATIVSMIVTFILTVGLYQSLLNCARGKGEFSIRAWSQPATVYVKIFVAQIIVSFLTTIGIVLCILPGLYIYGRLQFTVYYLLDHEEAGIMEAIQASWDMTQQDAFTLVGLMFVYIGLAILGLMCCCLGTIVTTIITYFAIVVCYLTLSGNFNAETKVETKVETAADAKPASDGYNRDEKA